MIRTRFAPSPTGLLHIGNARAAFFSALLAKQAHGVFILRIEDTDAQRSELRYIELIKADLEWLGVHWQEGLGKDGEYGPYWQSQRHPIYLHYYEKLVAKGLIYPCFCSDEELALERKLQLSRGQAPRYRGTCAQLSSEEVDKRLAQGLKPTLRFRVPQKKEIKFDDLIKGPQSFQSGDIGDFIIRRADGSASFMFCNAIDDVLMKVTHVLRGEDHLANTPRQLMIMQALELTPPAYGHLALITGDDGTPLSKRHGSYSLHDLRERGYLPQAVSNYLGRLGHAYEQQGLLSFEQLATDFHLERVSRSAARFDIAQLLYWQKMAVAALDTQQLWTWIGTQIQQQVPVDSQAQFIETIRANLCFPEDAAQWATIFFHHRVAFSKDNLQILQQAGEQFFVEAEEAVEEHGDDFKKIAQTIKDALHLNGKDLYLPLRIALTGQENGPELAQIAALLGVKRMRERFSRAFHIASGKASD